MTAPTLLTALTRLPGRTRETLSHLLIDLERGTTACVPDPDHGDQLEGPLTQEVPLLEQLQALAGSGLWGRVLWEEAAGTTMRVQLWADDREAWRKRLLLAGRSQAALAALEAGGDLKLATWRRESAMARLRDQVHHADAAGIGRTDLITLTQIARSTLYGFFKDAPQVEHGSGGPDVAWLPQSAAEATPPAQVPAPRTPTPAAPRRQTPLRSRHPLVLRTEAPGPVPQPASRASPLSPPLWMPTGSTSPAGKSTHGRQSTSATSRCSSMSTASVMEAARPYPTVVRSGSTLAPLSVSGCPTRSTSTCSTRHQFAPSRPALATAS